MVQRVTKTGRLDSSRRIAVLAVLLLLGAAGLALAPARVGDERRPAPVMGAGGADWLERPGRDEEQKPDEIIRTMALKKGDVVADLGAGTGYFTRRLARAVASSGVVYAVDIQPEMLSLLKDNMAKAGVRNVVPVLGEVDDPKLPRASLDWVLLVDVYHELQQPKATLAKVREALKPGGRVALVEYRLEGLTALHVREEHRMSTKQVLSEWEPAGFRLVKLYEFLPVQHFFVFERTPNR
jgi:ubiquinone/menaquinone biosynthesis C-methylase UbiE